jgi:hypothetical protein
MDDHPHATDNALQAEQKLLISTVSDEALEKAAGGTSWGSPIQARASRRSVSRTSRFLRSSAAKSKDCGEHRQAAGAIA